MVLRAERLYYDDENRGNDDDNGDDAQSISTIPDMEDAMLSKDDLHRSSVSPMLDGTISIIEHADIVVPADDRSILPRPPITIHNYDIRDASYFIVTQEDANEEFEIVEIPPELIHQRNLSREGTTHGRGFAQRASRPWGIRCAMHTVPAALV